MTGVQTCALPILKEKSSDVQGPRRRGCAWVTATPGSSAQLQPRQPVWPSSLLPCGRGRGGPGTWGSGRPWWRPGPPVAASSHRELPQVLALSACHGFAVSSGIILEILLFKKKRFLSFVEITRYVCLQNCTFYASSQEYDFQLCVALDTDSEKQRSVEEGLLPAS